MVGLEFFATRCVGNAKEFFVVLLNDLPSLRFTIIGFNKLVANKLGRVKDGGWTTKMFGEG